MKANMKSAIAKTFLSTVQLLAETACHLAATEAHRADLEKRGGKFSKREDWDYTKDSQVLARTLVIANPEAARELYCSLGVALGSLNAR